MRILLLTLTAFAVSGCGGSPMSVQSRTESREELTAQQLQTIRLNDCNRSTERCARGAGADQ